MSTRHLSEEQFGELLAGNTTDPAAMQHLQACAVCRSELDAVGSGVGDLRELSLKWAEQRALRIDTPSLWKLRWQAIPGWSAAAAALLLCGIAVGMHTPALSHGLSQQQTTAQTRAQTAAQMAAQTTAQLSQNDPAATVAAAPSDNELAQDNRLLRSINDELQQQIRPQVPASELAASARSGRQGLPREVVN